MAYEVLARKWRPRRFADVVGQSHVTVTLENAIRAGRLAHGFLFCGPRGVGKTTTARILAKCLNCEKAQDGPVPEPCNECAACVEIAEGRNLDVLEIDGASNRGIDEIRDLRENVRYAPSGGRAKVYIIDEVHMLTKEAFNALLKTLEEPPPGVYFVFATTEVHKVPATIRSRCQRYDFHRIAPEQIRSTLTELAKSEKFQVEPAAIQELARHAEGGLRDAQSLLDQAAAVGEGKVTLEGVRSLLGEAQEEALLGIAASVVDGDTGQAFVGLQELLDRGLDPGRVATSLAGTLRDLLVARTAGEEALALGVRPDLVDEYRALAERVSAAKLTALLTLAGRTVADLRRSARPRLTLEVALARLCRLEDPGELASLVARLEELSTGTEGGTAPPSPPPAETGAARPKKKSRGPARKRNVDPSLEELPPPPAEPPPGLLATEAGSTVPEPEPAASGVSPASARAGDEGGTRGEGMTALWSELVTRVERRKRSLGSFLRQGAPTSWDGDTLTAVFENDYYEGRVTVRESSALIHEELKGLAGKVASFRARVGKLPIGARAVEADDPAATEQPRRSRDLLEDNPGLRRAIHDLGGRLLPGDS